MAAAKKDKAENAKQVKDAHADKDKGAASSKGGGLLGKLLIVAFVSGVIITETFVFFFLVPSGEEVAALAEHRLITLAQEIDAKEKEHNVEEDRIVEFDLGTFSVAFIPPGATNKYRVEFRLFGELHSTELEHFQSLFDERQGRFRNRINLEIRNASMQELEETNLGLIHRRLLATSTEILGVDSLLNIGFQDYQVMEE